MTPTRLLSLKIIFAVLALATSFTAAQDGQGMILRTLDEPVTVNIPEMPVKRVLSRLAGQTGLSIRMDNKALEMLPYGEETRLLINARESLPGDILSAMLRPKCLDWSVEGRDIVIKPNKLLARLGRRPTYSETHALAAMATEDLQPEQAVMDQMREITGMATLKIVWPTMDELAQARAVKAAERKLPCTPQEYLDGLCENRGLTWILTGEKIMIITETRQVRRLLGRIISASYSKRPLSDIIMDLAHQAGLRVKMEPGIMATVSSEVRDEFTLILTRTTIAEAFEAITGTTGLVFEPDELGIRVAAPPLSDQAKATAPLEKPDYLLVATVTGHSGETYQMLIRPDELPENIRKELTEKKAEIIRILTGGQDRISEVQTKDKEVIQ